MAPISPGGLESNEPHHFHDEFQCKAIYTVVSTAFIKRTLRRGAAVSTIETRLFLQKVGT